MAPKPNRATATIPATRMMVPVRLAVCPLAVSRRALKVLKPMAARAMAT
jgi:hypothetical protein